MSNPNKSWSWGGAFGRGVGSGLSGAATGALAGALGGPLGVPLGSAVGAAIGFSGGLVGAGLGYVWDDLAREIEAYGSGALFTLVASTPLNFLLLLLADGKTDGVDNWEIVFTLIVFCTGLISAAGKSLLDDLHAAYTRPREGLIR